MIKKLKLALKLLAIGFTALLVLAIGLSVYLTHLDFNDYKPQLQQAVKKATGRELKIDGRLALHLSLRPSLRVEGVHLANAAWASRKNMMDVQSLEADVQLLPLFSGHLVIDRIILQRPEISLETNASGTGNWTFLESASPVSETTHDTHAALRTLPKIGYFLLRDARFYYRDGKSGKRWQLNIPQARLNSDSSQTGMPLHFALQVQYQQNLIAVSGSVAPTPDAKGVHLKMTIKNKRMKSPRMAGFSLLRHAPFIIHATLFDDEHSIIVKQFELLAEGLDMRGSVHLHLDRDKPYIEAGLTSKKIDVGQWLGAERTETKGMTTSAKTENKEKRLFSSAPIHLTALRDIDANVTWKVAKLLLDADRLNIRQFDMKLILHKGVMVIKRLHARVAGGDVLATLRLDAATPSIKFDTSIRAKGILAGRLLKNAGESILEKGSLKVRIALAGGGKSVAAMMAHLNGRIKISMGKARVKTTSLNLIGGDLLMSAFNKLNPFSDSPPYTKFQCGVVHFRVENGLLLSKDGIAFETGRMNILSHGTINLRDESIDLSIGTEPREGLGLNISNMVNVVKLGGTLAEPALVMDAGKTGKAAARVAGAVITGGLSLLGESVFNRLTADKSPCHTAMQ